MKIETLLNEEVSGTTTSNMSGGTFVSPMKDKDGVEVVKRVPMKRLKGQFASYGLGEKSCKGCDLIHTSYDTMGSKRSPKLITCQMCGTNHKVK